MSGLLELPENYGKVMAKIKTELDGKMLGIVMTDCAMLRDIVRLAHSLTLQTTEIQGDPVDRIKLMLLGTLASTYTFNHQGLELGQGFPHSLPRMEMVRWYVGLRYTQYRKAYGHPTSIEALDKIFSGLYEWKKVRTWELQAQYRIGDCGMYVSTAAVTFASTSLFEEVMVFGKPPHAWLRLTLKHPKGRVRRVDLSSESHGMLEETYDGLRADAEDQAPLKIDLTV